MLNYKDHLCGKIDLLHDNFEINCKEYLNLLSIITKIQETYMKISKKLKSINSFEEKSILSNTSNSLYPLIALLKYNLSLQSQEFFNLSNYIQTEIIEKNSKMINDMRSKEKIFRNEFLNLSKNLKESKERNNYLKNIFFNNAACSEKSLISQKNLQTNSLIPIRNKKNKGKGVFEQLENARISENNYFDNIINVNLLIENKNNKEIDLLNLYQIFQNEYFKRISNNIYFLLSGFKSCYSVILSDINSIEPNFMQIDTQKDINTFITENKSDQKQEKLIEFIPYSPISSLDESLNNNNIENLERNFEIISNLRKYFRKIYENKNFDEETQKHEFRQLCLKIFKNSSEKEFPINEKKKLIDFMNNKDYRKFFLLYLNNHRAKGEFKITEILFNILSDILEAILKYAQNEKNYDDAKLIIILSQTYYKECIEKNEKKIIKVFLVETLKKFPWFKETAFWKELIKSRIDLEIKKKENDIKTINKTNYLKKIVYSNLLTYSTNMEIFGIDYNTVKEIIKDYIKFYELDKNFEDIIILNIDTIFNQVKNEQKVHSEIEQNNEIIENNNVISEINITNDNDITNDNEDMNLDERKDKFTENNDINSNKIYTDNNINNVDDHKINEVNNDDDDFVINNNDFNIINEYINNNSDDIEKNKK